MKKFVVRARIVKPAPNIAIGLREVSTTKNVLENVGLFGRARTLRTLTLLSHATALRNSPKSLDWPRPSYETGQGSVSGAREATCFARE